MEQRQDALVVPSAAIQNGVQGTFVWEVGADAKGGGTAKIQPVKVGLAQGQVTIIESGVEAGQKVVVDGADRLRPGAQVIVSQAKHTDGGAGSRGQGSGRDTMSNSAAPAGAGANPQGGRNGGRRPNKEQQ
jgi:multidrug efflux system membrane fusion protein